MTDEQFRQMIDEAVQAHGINEIADYLMVSGSTVYRWYVGKNTPHPFMRDGILNAIEEMETLDER